MALKSEEPMPGMVSKSDNLASWLGMEMEKTPILPNLPIAKPNPVE